MQPARVRLLSLLPHIRLISGKAVDSLAATTFSSVSLLHKKSPFNIFHPLSSTRAIFAYRREKISATGILQRHFRQPDIVQPGKAVNQQYVDAMVALGFPRAKMGMLKLEYSFETVEALLAFLNKRSYKNNLYNGLSLLSLFLGALITWYYSRESMLREEQRLMEEAMIEREREKEEQQKQQWESLFDVKQTSLSEPGFHLPSAQQMCKDTRPVVTDILDIVYCHHQQHHFHQDQAPIFNLASRDIQTNTLGESSNCVHEYPHATGDHWHEDDGDQLEVDSTTLSRNSVYESAFVNVIVGPPGCGKTQLVRKIFMKHLRLLSRAAASNQPPPLNTENVVLFYLDFKDAFKVNITNRDLVTAKFFDFLDELQHRALINGENISLFIDSADFLTDFFHPQLYPQVIRHVHETGRFANVFLIYNSYANYEKLKQFTGIATQHRLLTVPFISNQLALLEFVRHLREQVTSSTTAKELISNQPGAIKTIVPENTSKALTTIQRIHSQWTQLLSKQSKETNAVSAQPKLQPGPKKWDIDDNVLVDALGGQFNDYMKIKRTVLVGRQTAKDVLAQLLIDSHERVETALGIYEKEIDAIHCYYYHLAQAILEGRDPPIPYALRRTFMLRNMFFDASNGDQMKMNFFFPRDKAVFFKMWHDPIYQHHFTKLEATSKTLTLNTTTAARKLIDWFELRKDKDDVKTWWQRAIYPLFTK